MCIVINLSHTWSWLEQDIVEVQRQVEVQSMVAVQGMLAVQGLVLLKHCHCSKNRPLTVLA